MTFLPLIAQATAKGSLAIVLIGIAHVLIGRRLPARWWCALWLLALVRLVAPVTLPWSWSLYNFVPIHPGIELQLRASAFAVPLWIGAWKWLVAVWACGFLFVTARIIVASARTQLLVWRALDSGGATPAAWHIVEKARAELRIRRKVLVVESPLIDGPALHGVLRPALLLPDGMCRTFGEDELRHVILHELAHLRRHDIAVNWLLNAIRAVHWFNPLVWLAVGHVQEERELACDELSLSCLRPNERIGYGLTILKLIEQFRSSERVPALVGIVNQKQQMRRRLIMIRSDRCRSRLMLPVVAVLCAIGLMGLADAPVSSRSCPPKTAASGPPCVRR
ncbi:MAG TPA: M56 family metallopeptidase [Thermoanaerobaculia bacterium]|nr:M56 family metallopeptidase [Thermoanaerobaculia bacterium]